MSFTGQVLHVFREDVRRYWPALVGLGVLMGVHRTVGLPLPQDHLRPFADVIPFFPLLFGLLTVIVIQDQRLAGDSGFWGSRPLGGTEILVAKAAFIGLFLCVVPVLVQVQWLVSLAGGGDAGRLIESSLLFQGGFLALVAAGAAVTPNLTAFTVLGALVWVGLGLLSDRLAPSFDYMHSQDAIAIAGRWVWLVVGSAVLLHQYRTRRTTRSVVAGLVALLILSIPAYRGVVDRTEASWPVDSRTPYPRAPEVELRVSSVDHGVQHDPGSDPTSIVRTYLASERGPGVTLSVNEARTEFYFGGQRQAGFRYRPPEFDRVNRAFNRRMPLGDVPPAGLTGGYRPSGASLTLIQGPVDGIAELKVDSIQVDVELDVFTRVARSEWTIAKAAELSIPEGHLRIQEVIRAPRALTLDLSAVLTATPASLAALRMKYGVTLHLYSPRYEEYALLVGANGGRQAPDRLGPHHYFVGGSMLVRDLWSLAVDLDSRMFRTSLPDDWLDGARLVFGAYRYEGSFRRAFSLPIDGLPGPNDAVRFPEVLREGTP